MALELFRKWLPAWSIHTTTRRHRPATLGSWECLELLEPRYLLSASHGHGGTPHADEASAGTDSIPAKSHAHDPKSKFTVPDISGTWSIVTHASFGDVHGLLVLQQHGKKVTGTLTNDGQPPGAYKAKFILGKSESWHTTGTCLNFSVASKKTHTDADYEDDDDDDDGDTCHGEFDSDDEEDGKVDYDGEREDEDEED